MPPKCYRIAVKAFGSWVVSSPTLDEDAFRGS
jgi:hypothetical protein